jgi:alpha-tubulin suppressor-like RCC1 family protein
VDVEHRVFVFGSNRSNEFNLKTKANQKTPREKKSWFNKTIIPGGDHVLIVDEEGSVFLYGCIPGVNLPMGKQENIEVQRKRSLTKRAVG